MDALFIEGEALIRETISGVIPLATTLLQELDRGQIDALETALAEGREALTQCSAKMPDMGDEWQIWRRETE